MAIEPGTISYAVVLDLEVMDVPRTNVWKAIKDVLSVEQRTCAVMSVTDASTRPYAVVDRSRGPF